MRRLMLLAGLCALLLPGQVRVSRATLEPLERGFDRTISGLDVNDPSELLGTTRGVYLEGYGAVFTAEANLAITAISPFHPAPDQAGLVRLRERKLKRLGVLKTAMRESLIAVARALDNVPPQEQVVLAVTLFYLSTEHREGLPGQVIMQAQRQALLDLKSGKLNGAAAASAIRVQEL